MTVPVQPQFDAEGFRKAAKQAGYSELEIESEITRRLGPQKNIFQKLKEDDDRQENIFKGALLKSAANTLDRIDSGAKWLGEKTGLGSGGAFGKGRDFLLSKVPEVQAPENQSKMDQWGDKLVAMGGAIAGELPAQLAITSAIRAPLAAAANANTFMPGFVRAMLRGGVPGSYFKSVAAATPLNMTESVALDAMLHPENLDTKEGVLKSAAQGLIGAGLEARATSAPNPMQGPKAPDPLGQILASDRQAPKISLATQIRQKVFNPSAPFMDLGDKDLPNSAYNLARRLSGVNDQVHLVQNEQVMIPQRGGGYRISQGPTTKQLIQEVGQDPVTLGQWDRYLLGKSGYKLAVDPAEVAGQISRIEQEYPHFTKAYELYKQKVNDIADMYYGYGLIDSDIRDSWKNQEELIYVPTGRKMSNPITSPNHMKKKTNTESLREISSPMAQLYKLEQNLIKRGETNKLGQQMLADIRADPDKWKGAIEEVRGPFVGGRNDPVEHEMEKIAEQYKAANIPVPPLKQLRALAEVSTDELLDGSAGKLRVVENGMPVDLRISDPLFLDYFKARKYVEPSTIGTAFRKTERTATRTFFQPFRELIGKNALYDQWEGFMNSKWNEFFPGWDFMRGFYAQKGDLPGINKLLDLKNDPRVNLIRAERGGIASRYMDPKGLENVNSWNEFVNNIDREKNGANVVLRNPLQAMHELMGVMSASTRYGAAIRKMEQSGGDAAAAANASRNILADPQQVGTAQTVKLLANSSFANYQLQTLDRMYQAMEDNPITFATKGAITIAAPSAGLWLLNRNDQEIQDLRKSKGGENYWFVRNPQSKEVYAVPKPYLQGQMFGTSMEAALDQMEPRAAEQLAKGLIQNLVPNPVPITVGLGAELVFGKNIISFMDNPIPLAPSRAEGALPEDVAGNNTFGIAKEIAGKTGISAVNVDNLMRTILFSQVANVYDRIDRKMFNRIAPETKGTLPFGAMRVNPNRSNVEPMNTFYDTYSKLTEIGKSIDMAISKGDTQRLQELQQKYPKDYSLYQAYDAMNEVLGTINSQINLISNNKMLSPDERRERVNELKKMMITKTRAWNQLMGSQVTKQ